MRNLIYICVLQSQPIDINSINFNTHASNDCDSPSGSDNIAARVRARNEPDVQRVQRVRTEG